jgi:hypothetical protein
MEIKSVAALKRAMPVGTVVHVENLLHPDRSGPRTVLKAQTKDWMLSWPEGMPNPNNYQGGWLQVPKAGQVRFLGGQTVELLDGDRPWLRLAIVD